MDKKKMNLHVKPQEDDVFAKIIQQLLQVTKMNLIVQQIAAASMQKAKASISNGSPDADPTTLEETLMHFEREFQQETPNLMTAIEALYRQVFSVEDATGVVEFYNSEVGQRFLVHSSAIEQNMQQIVQNWSSCASKTAFERAITCIEQN